MARESPRKKRAAQELGIREPEEVAESSKKGDRSTRRATRGVAVLEGQDEDLKCSQSASLQEIKHKLEDLANHGGEAEELQKYILELEADSRAGVIALIAKARDSVLEPKIEEERLNVMMEYESRAFTRYMTEERSLLKAGSDSTIKKLEIVEEMTDHYLIGVDEVGVGPLAGPIVSCAVVFRYTALKEILGHLKGIDDSKKLSAIKRQSLARIIREHCVDHCLGIVSAKEVDEINPLQGSLIAMQRAVLGVASIMPSERPIFDVFVDHHTIPDLDDSLYRQTSITKGDSKSIVIASASILAKVYRDEYMTKLHEEYPQFGFDRNAGYGTKDHLYQLKKGDLCPEHRLSYEPVRQARRIAMGLPPDLSPKKKATRTKSVSPTKLLVTRSKPLIGSASAVAVLEAPVNPPSTANHAKPSIFSLSWWTRLLSTSPSTQQQ